MRLFIPLCPSAHRPLFSWSVGQLGGPSHFTFLYIFFLPHRSHLNSLVTSNRVPSPLATHTLLYPALLSKALPKYNRTNCEKCVFFSYLYLSLGVSNINCFFFNAETRFCTLQFLTRSLQTSGWTDEPLD